MKTFHTNLQVTDVAEAAGRTGTRLRGRIERVRVKADTNMAHPMSIHFETTVAAAPRVGEYIRVTVAEAPKGIEIGGDVTLSRPVGEVVLDEIDHRLSNDDLN